MIFCSTGYVAEFPKNHARIGYDNCVPEATVSATSEAAGFPASAVKNQLTYEAWKPSTVPATLTIQFPERLIDYIGIAASTVETDGATLTIELERGGQWVEATFFEGGTGATLSLDFVNQEYSVYEEVLSNRAMIYQLGAALTTGIRITMTGSAASLGVVYCGKMLEMYRPFYGGHTPGVLSRTTTVKPNKSVNGQWLGRSIIRQGLSAEYSWKHTPIGWYQENVEPFSKAAITSPFFVAWNPAQFPDHVLYAWTSDDIKPTLMGVRDYCEFGFSVEGYDS